MIDIRGISKAKILAALYNASKPQGRGYLQFTPSPMTESEAQVHIENQTYFDYLKGRVMRVDLSGDSLDPWGYDRDNGEGAAENAILKAMEND